MATHETPHGVRIVDRTHEEHDLDHDHHRDGGHHGSPGEQVEAALASGMAESRLEHALHEEVAARPAHPAEFTGDGGEPIVGQPPLASEEPLAE